MAEKRESNAGELKVYLNLDCADALKGLKAVTRAAKKATTVLKELEEQQIKMNQSVTTTINLDGRQISKIMEAHMDKIRSRGASI